MISRSYDSQVSGQDTGLGHGWTLDTLTQAVFHGEQFLYLGFHELGDGNMRPLGDDFRDILGIYLFFEHTRTFEVGQLRLHLLNLSL